jgi:hypothetical protein
MDGLHVGRYLTRLEEVLRNPESFIISKNQQDERQAAM